MKLHLLVLAVGLLLLTACSAPAPLDPTVAAPSTTAVPITPTPVAAAQRTPTIPLPQTVSLPDVGVRLALPAEWNVVRNPGVVLIGPGLDWNNSIERTWMHISTKPDLPLALPELIPVLSAGMRDVGHIQEFTTAQFKVAGFDAAAIWWKQNVPRDPNVPEYWLDVNVPAQGVVRNIAFHPILLSPDGKALKGMAQAILESAQIFPTPRAANGLSIEEHALKDAPELETLAFVPVEGTQREILNKHEALRAQPQTRAPVGQTQFVYMKDRYAAELIPLSNGQKTAVQVSRNGQPVYTVPVGDASPAPNLLGLWGYDNHWVLEVAHTDRKQNPAKPNEIAFDVRGEIIRDGVSLNQQNGYEEAFGVQLIGGRLFYFFKRLASPGVFRYGVSYDNRNLDLAYSDLPHYGCCSAAALNPWRAESMVAFYAQRNGTWYYVEIGAFD